MLELILIIITIIILSKYIKEKRENSNIYYEEDNFQNTSASYSQKDFLTYSEKNFYLKLQPLENMGYKIIPQINLATVIQKHSAQKFHNELFRIIDFGIFDHDFNLLLLIELNDQTHNQINRKDRDLKVKNLCNLAKINLITFYTKYPNNNEYVINRILKELNKNDNSDNNNTQNNIATIEQNDLTK